MVRARMRQSAWDAAPDRRPGWRVAATLREPVEVAAAFACHHLDAGASRVTLFFDDPDDPAIDIVGGLDRVDVVRCDDAHWQRLAGGRPATHYQRQVLNIRAAFRATGDDWLFHIDADEFLLMPGGILPDVAPLGRRTRWLRVPVAERIWDGPGDADDLFGGVFRRPLAGGPAAVDRVYGAGHAHLYPAGTSGHPSGKAMIRPGAPIAATAHTVTDPDTGAILPHRPARHITLLHFDGLSKCHWALKHLRQVGRLLAGEKLYRDARRAVTVDILNADDPLARAFAWFDRIYRFDPQTLARLRASGHLLAPDLHIAAATRRLLPQEPLDFTPRAIDRQLEDRIEAALAEVRAARRHGTFS